MLDIRYSSQFKKDIRRLKRQGKDLEKLREAILLLAEEVALPAHYLDHSLRGQWNKLGIRSFILIRVSKQTELTC